MVAAGVVTASLAAGTVTVTTAAQAARVVVMVVTMVVQDEVTGAGSLQAAGAAEATERKEARMTAVLVFILTFFLVFPRDSSRNGTVLVKNGYMDEAKKFKKKGLPWLEYQTLDSCKAEGAKEGKSSRNSERMTRHKKARKKRGLRKLADDGRGDEGIVDRRGGCSDICVA